LGQEGILSNIPSVKMKAPTCAVASWQATRWNAENGDVSEDHFPIRRETEAHVWAQLEVANTASDVLVVRVV